MELPHQRATSESVTHHASHDAIATLRKNRGVIWCWSRDFEELIQNDLLALQASVHGPLDETSHVSRSMSWPTDIIDVALTLRENNHIKSRTDTECFGISLKERVFLGLDNLAGTEGSSSGFAETRFGFEPLRTPFHSNGTD